METVQEQTFTDQRIVIGEKRYVRCKFVRCSLVFNGTPDENVACSFIDCAMSLEGPAVHTLRYLRSMWGGGGRGVVEQFGRDYAGLPLRFGDPD